MKPGDQHYELSDETAITLHADGTATLEVIYDGDLAAVALTAFEVDSLRAILNQEAQP